MRIATFTGFGGSDGVSVREADDPDPESTEAVVSVEACSINRHDLWILEGDSAMVDTDSLPFLSGLDVAGVVESVGERVDTVSPGDRVVLCPNETCGSCRYCREGPENLCEDFSLYHGGLAEKAVVPANRLIPLPDEVGMTQAATLPTAYVTAWRMLRRARVTAGDLVFVPGATGGVGVASVQLVDVLGAHSIGTSTSAEKLARIEELGADYTIQSADPGVLEAELREIGETDAVLNHLGGEYTDLGLRTLRRGGRMVVCGRTASETSKISVPDLFLSHTHLIGSTMGTQGDLERLVGFVADDVLDPVVGGEYPLEETGQAFADMQERGRVGKLVVKPN
jgi:NADPH:quinone reductase-like Zn-dependent oxidoreductase